MSRRQKANTFIAFSDFLLALMNTVFILFIAAMMSMAAKVHSEDGVKLDAQYLIEASWSLDYDADVDLYVRDPLGNVVYFAQKEAGSLHLDHDSRGHLSDVEKLPDGTEIKPTAYTEIVTLRGIVPGEYTVNLHLYGAWYPKSQVMDHAVGAPYTVPVHVRIVKLNPSVVTEFDQTATLESIWEERTVTRFTLGAGGVWISADPTPMSLQHH